MKKQANNRDKKKALELKMAKIRVLAGAELEMAVGGMIRDLDACGTGTGCGCTCTASV
jgi:hypothetical protein